MIMSARDNATALWGLRNIAGPQSSPALPAMEGGVDDSTLTDWFACRIFKTFEVYGTPEITGYEEARRREVPLRLLLFADPPAAL